LFKSIFGLQEQNVIRKIEIAKEYLIIIKKYRL
jgi:hypothetical protein